MIHISNVLFIRYGAAWFFSQKLAPPDAPVTCEQDAYRGKVTTRSQDVEITPPTCHGAPSQGLQLGLRSIRKSVVNSDFKDGLNPARGAVAHFISWRRGAANPARAP